MSKIRASSVLTPISQPIIPAAEEEEKKEYTRPAAQEEQSLNLTKLPTLESDVSKPISFIPPKLFSNPEPQKIQNSDYLPDEYKRKILLLMLQKMRNETRRFSSVSNVFKTRIETIKNSINNMR